MVKKNLLKKTAIFIAAGLLFGCAGSPEPEPVQMALGKWQSRAVNADGSKKEWPWSAPQYKNSGTDTKIWVSNNAEQICVLAEVKDPGMARQLTQGGLTLSVKTKEKDAKPFSIRLKGRTPFRPRKGQTDGPQKGDLKDRKTPDPPAMAQEQPPDPRPEVKLPDTLMVTYPFSSGPITMTMKEARSTGIALGLAEAGRHTLIFEAVISLDAIFFDVPRISGTVVNIDLSADGRPAAMRQPEKLKSSKEDRPKEGPPGGSPPDQADSGTTPDHKKQENASNERFRAAVEITLAGPPK